MKSREGNANISLRDEEEVCIEFKANKQNFNKRKNKIFINCGELMKHGHMLFC